MPKSISKRRLNEILENILTWAVEHSDEWMEAFISAAGFTEREIEEFDLTEYIQNYEDEDI